VTILDPSDTRNTAVLAWDSSASNHGRLLPATAGPITSVFIAGTGPPTTNLIAGSWEFVKPSVTTYNTYAQSTRIECQNPVTADFTISAWIKTTGSGMNNSHYQSMYIVSAETAGGNTADWGLGVNAAGCLAFGSGPSDVTIATTIRVNTGKWCHVAVTRVSSTGLVNLYINGTVSFTGTCSTGTLNSNPVMCIGSGNDAGGKTFVGSIGRIVVSRTVLPAADIRFLYQSASPRYV
jgi:hypothetical protein